CFPSPIARRCTHRTSSNTPEATSDGHKQRYSLFEPPMSTLRDLRNIYGRCAVCLQCHKTAIQSVQLLEGQEQVKEAIALGLLDPKVEYDFAHINNGTLQCLTCNAYFTQGLLVWSPSKQVLEWLDREISDAKDIDAVCKIFCSLNQVPELVHLHNYFSLIPLFLKFPEIERQDLLCVSPLPSLGRESQLHIPFSSAQCDCTLEPLQSITRGF
ncbi:hypothetical protein B0H14DRAFT_3779174, partial [Mycena olivaceomarginata]